MNRLVLAAGAALALAAPALAHHSFAMFDQRQIMTLEGTVTEFQWTNPHAFIEIDVPGERGAVTHWSIELNSPNNLKRQGWTRTALRSGDRVTRPSIQAKANAHSPTTAMASSSRRPIENIAPA